MKKELTKFLMVLFVISQVILPSFLVAIPNGISENRQIGLSIMPRDDNARVNFWRMPSYRIFASYNYLYVSFIDNEIIEFDVSNQRSPNEINSGISGDSYWYFESITNCTFFADKNIFLPNNDIESSISILQHDSENLRPHNYIVNSSQEIYQLAYADGKLFCYSRESYNSDQINFLTYEFIYPNNLTLISNQTLNSIHPLLGSELTSRNEYLYLISNDGNSGTEVECDLRVLNSTDYTIIDSVSISAERSIDNLLLSDDFLFIKVDNKLRVYNTSNPEQLVLQKVFNEINVWHYFVTNNFLFIVTTNETGDFIYNSEEILMLNVSDFSTIDSFKGDSFGAIYADESMLYVSEAAISNYKGPFFYIFKLNNDQEIVKLYHSELLHPWALFLLLAILILSIAILLIFILSIIRNKNKRLPDKVTKS